MATYELTGPNGEKYELVGRGDQPPSQDTIARAKAAMSQDVSIPKTNPRDLRGLLGRVYQNITSKETEPLGGVTGALTTFGVNPVGTIPRLALSASGIPEEKLAVPIGAVGGGYLGGMVGKPNLGAGLGATAGSLVEQGSQKLRQPEKQMDISQAILTGGGVTAGGKVLETLGKVIGVSSKIIPERARAKMFDKALQAVELGRKTLSKNWERSINALAKQNPDVQVDLSQAVNKLINQVANIDDTVVPQLKTAMRNSPRLAEVINDPIKASTLNIKEAQDLKNAITSATHGITRKAMKGKTTPNERVVFDILDDIDDAITKKFPDMIEIRKLYRQGKRQYELARPLVEPGASVESSILNKPQGLFGLGGSPLYKSTQGRLAVKDIMSRTKPGEKLYEATKLAHALNRISDAVGRLGQITVGGAILGKLTGGKSNRMME